MDLNALPWKDIFTIGASAVGAVLGVINMWNSINQRRVRLKIIPKHIVAPHHRGELFGIEVINLSAFPVTVDEVGFTLNGRRADRGERASVVRPIIPDNGTWPRRLEAREAVTTMCQADQFQRHSKLGKAYAQTACGEFRYGDSPARKQLSAAVEAGRPIFRR